MLFQTQLHTVAAFEIDLHNQELVQAHHLNCILLQLHYLAGTILTCLHAVVGCLACLRIHYLKIWQGTGYSHLDQLQSTARQDLRVANPYGLK